jgi:hypothetical protein
VFVEAITGDIIQGLLLHPEYLLRGTRGGDSHRPHREGSETVRLLSVGADCPRSPGRDVLPTELDLEDYASAEWHRPRHCDIW